MNYTIVRNQGSGTIVWSEDQIRYIINEYTEQDRTLKSLSEEFSIQPQSIRNLLRKNNIEITNKKTRLYPRNSNYFNQIDTQDKAYWLGMLLSDGSITNGNSINLGLKDKEHLEKFKQAIAAPAHKIITIEDNRYNPPCINYRLSIRDKKMAQDLAKYNIVPNKSYIDFSFPDIPEEFYPDFIRGYFDGDGSIYFTNNKYILSWVGNKKFLTDLKIILNKENISLCQNSKSKITYDLKISGAKDVFKILHYMYDNSTTDIRLDRKYKIVHSALSLGANTLEPINIGCE